MTRPKLSVRIGSDAAPDQLQFVKELGVGHVYTWVREDQRDYDSLARLRARVEDAGLTLYNVGSYEIAKSDKIHLALPGRDAVIAEFQDFVRNLGRAGITVTTFTWEPTQVWSSEPGETRGAKARRVDLKEMHARPMTHGRRYTEEEIWENFAYFMERMMPVAEEAGVRMALHPNDPPAESLGGIPNLIHSFESYKRAFELADSPNLGMEFCTGCWLEGGMEGFGDIFEGIRTFVADDRVLLVHFRNVSSPLPTFVETFLDNGYMDMYRVMRTFYEAGYENTIALDHTPMFTTDDPRATGTAYAIGYMRALMERAEAELGEG